MKNFDWTATLKIEEFCLPIASSKRLRIVRGEFLRYRSSCNVTECKLMLNHIETLEDRYYFTICMYICHKVFFIGTRKRRINPQVTSLYADVVGFFIADFDFIHFIARAFSLYSDKRKAFKWKLYMETCIFCRVLRLGSLNIILLHPIFWYNTEISGTYN